MLTVWEKEQKRIARSFASQASAISEPELEGAIKGLNRFVFDTSQKIEKIRDLDTISQFNYFLEDKVRQAENTVDVPYNPIKVFESLASDLKERFKKRGVVSASMEVQMDATILRAKTGLIPKARRQSTSNLYQYAQAAYGSLSADALNSPLPETIEKIKGVKSIALTGLDPQVKEQERAELAATMDISEKIAEQIAEQKSQLRLQTGEDSEFSYPILGFMPPFFADKTKISTDLTELQQKNPLLAMAFLRIKNLNSLGAQDLITKLQEELPTSPEIPYIALADKLRSEELAADPIAFGEKQNIFPTDASNFFIVGSNTTISDLRFKNARTMLERYGTTRLFKKVEIATAPQDSAVQAKLFSELQGKLEQYNLQNPDKRLSPVYLENDLMEINPDLTSYLKTTRYFNSMDPIKYPQVKSAIDGGILKDVKFEKLPVAFTMTDGFLNSFKMLVAEQRLFGDADKLDYAYSDFFQTTDNYYYVKGRPGATYSRSVRDLLQMPDVILRNINFDQYMALRPDGNPVLDQYGAYAVYDGKFLEDYEKKRLAGKKSFFSIFLPS